MMVDSEGTAARQMVRERFVIVDRGDGDGPVVVGPFLSDDDRAVFVRAIEASTPVTNFIVENVVTLTPNRMMMETVGLMAENR